jgi:threonine/homoserine/homoserine lactone efflux protein
MEITTSLSIAYITYFVGTSSPGPANLAIISTALQYGRSAAVSTALGVVAGSVMWGLISAFGLGALLSTWPVLLNALSLLGGVYLCFLAWGAFQKFLLKRSPKLLLDTKMDSTAQLKKYFFYGLALHLTNPKAMFVWISIIALGVSEGAEEISLPFLIVMGCGVIGIFVFGGYTLIFSNEEVVKLYIRASQLINFLIAALFFVAGLSLLYRSIVFLIAL